MAAHKIQPLYQLCLENIVHNADFWLQVKRNQEKKGKSCGPFDFLPAILSQELLDSYEQLHSVSGQNRSSVCQDLQDKWWLFVTPRVVHLAITEHTEMTSLAHIAATCRSLKHLELKNVQEVLSFLKAVVPCLTTIVTLNLETMAHVNSTSLKYIRNHCPNLRVLSLRSCFLNDKTVNHLKNMGNLTELDLRDTEVTAAGVCQVLRHNPQLCCLQHPDVVRALHKLHATRSWLGKAHPTAGYQLRNMELEVSRKDSPGLLAVVAGVCPALERIRVEIDMRASPLALAPLAQLRSLAELDVQCVAHSQPPDPCVTFFEGSIVPILQERGVHLVTISLEGVLKVDMRLIERHCPHVINLGLYYNSYVQDSFVVPKDILSSKPFPTLRRLMFGSNSGNNDFPASYLEWLLANQDLEELSLSGSPLFTKELFASAFANSCSFPRLRRLELEYCNVTTDVITEFLDRCGRKSLRELSICGPFVHEQATPALTYIACEKLDIQLEAYFYSFVKMKERMVRYKQDLNFISPETTMDAGDFVVGEVRQTGHQ